MNATPATPTVVGLGKVRLPLAAVFGRKSRNFGDDLSEGEVAAYRRHTDPIVAAEDLHAASELDCTTALCCLVETDFVIVVVSTTMDEHDIRLHARETLPKVDAVVLAVAHDALRSLSADQVAALLKPGGIVVDVKACLDVVVLRAAGLKVWRL